MQNYEKLEKVGEETYGKVYKARDKRTGRLVYFRKTRLEREDEGVPSTALREETVLQMLSQSIHIVKLLGVEHINKQGKSLLYSVFEYLDMDLYKNIDWRTNEFDNPLPPEIIQSFMYQLLKGVSHCHSHGVMLRDLTPQNLLVDKDKGTLKIAVLGVDRSSTVLLNSFIHEIVTLWYRAPEVLLGTTHSSMAADMWGVGCIFAELDRKSPLFSGNLGLHPQLGCIFRLLGTPNEEVWPGVSQLRDWQEYHRPRESQNIALAVPGLHQSGVDLLENMMLYNPSKRISAKAALHHPYFDDLDESQF